MLKCELCEFKSSRNLISHIESDHAKFKFNGQIGLAAYVMKYNPPDEKVFPTKKSNLKKLIGIDFPIQKQKCAIVPKINRAYQFTPQMKEITEDIINNKRVMLVGHTGCGKSSCIEQLAAHSNNGYIRVNFHHQTTVGDFIGLWTVRGSEMQWVDGALPFAMKHGYWLMLDEIDFADSAIIGALNPVLETNGKLMLKEKGYEIIEAHPNFRLFSTGNSIGCMQDYRTMYQGTNPLNEAFLDRWHVYRINYMTPAIERKMLSAYFPDLPKEVAENLVNLANVIRDGFEKEEINCTFSTRRLIDWTEKIIRHKDIIRAAEATIFSKVHPSDAEAIKGYFKRAK